MGARKLHFLSQLNNENVLREQLNLNQNVTGRLRAKVEEYLYSADIYSLEYVNLEVLADYRAYIETDISLSQSQKRAYRSGLEQFMLTYKAPEYPEVVNQIDEMGFAIAIRNKTLTYLMMADIKDVAEVTYDTRSSYINYLSESVAESKVHEYTESLDRLKLANIKNNMPTLGEVRFPYKREKVFLLYHPDTQIAESFHYIKNKEELLFDFSLSASDVMKRQIFEMLTWVLENKKDWKDRRERFIVPLKLFYTYCVSNGVEDINQLEYEHISGFKESLKGKVGTKEDVYSQIVENIRKILFLNAVETNWEANAWYLERFNFQEGRMNPARPILSISFEAVLDLDNRKAFKDYMKYLIGISQRISMQVVRTKYYEIQAFLKYCDDNDIKISQIGAYELERYINRLNEMNIEASYFNRQMVDICIFIKYLQAKGSAPEFMFHLNYYLKKSVTKHNDRFVPEDKETKVLEALGAAPEHLRLMFLNLWGIGLRVSEVCVIKGDSFIWDGDDAWIRIYQNKMKSEKRVPVPQTVYVLMTDYISRNQIGADEYVFKNRKGGAYDAGTFTKQMKAFIKDVGLDKDYIFKSHDFRHMVATKFHQDGTSIQTIRDYLGHREEDMTKQYIDFVPEEIDIASEDYFMGDGNDMSKKVLAKLKGDLKNGKEEN